MNETQAEQHVNGTAPAPTPPAADAQPCEDCATPMEKVIGILAIAFAGFIIIMGIDMITGGRIGGSLAAKVQEVTQ